jgi:hypothetical protein
MDNAYQWVPFYEALADKLLVYSDKRDQLFALMKNVSSEQPLMKYLHFEREDWWGPRHYQIDPFSVVGVMNRGTTDANRTVLAKVLAKTFDIKLSAPTQFAGIPTLDNRKSFFAGVDEIWELFILAVKVAETNSFTDEFKNAFEKAIAVSGNGLAYITMGLYWIRPNIFMPLDGNSRAYVSAKYGVIAPSSNCTGDEYVAFLDTLKAKIGEQSPNLTFPELSYTAWTQKDDKTSAGSSGTSDADEQKQRAAFRQWYINNGGSPNSANSYASAIGKTKLKNGRAVFAVAVYDELNDAIENGGLDGYFQTSGGDYTKMEAVFDIESSVQRDDLKSGIKHYLGFLQSKGAPVVSVGAITADNTPVGQSGIYRTPKNLILYGTPGTGKTYSSILYAVAIIEEKTFVDVKAENYDAVFARYLKYKEDGLIAFTTFHQSFGYEEFIEGIRPVVSSEDKAESGREIEYEVHDGIFKAFCDKAGAPVGSGADVDLGIGKNPTVWKVSLEGTGDNPTRTECFVNNHIRIGYDSYGETPPDSYEKGDNGRNILNAFYYKMQIGDIVLSCYSNKTIDAIGVITGEPEWHTVGGFSNASSNSCKCVAIATERDGISDCILKVRTFKECNNRLWHRILTAFIEAVGGTNFVKGSVKVIIKQQWNFLTDMFLSGLQSVPVGHHYAIGSRFCPLYTFRVVMCDTRRNYRQLPRIINAGFRAVTRIVAFVSIFGTRRNPHCRTVAPRVIGRTVIRVYPTSKSAAISCIGI